MRWAPGRLYRAGELAAAEVDDGLARLTTMPLTRHRVAELVIEVWARRDDLRLVDALYVARAARLDAPLVTTDHRRARACPRAESVPRHNLTPTRVTRGCRQQPLTPGHGVPSRKLSPVENESSAGQGPG